jgi:Protein of unknown function (DUF2845)
MNKHEKVYSAIIVIFLAIILVYPSIVPAFHCNGKFVSVGDSTEEVISKCGSPTSYEVWTEERLVRKVIRDNWTGTPFVVPRIIEVPYAQWTYNFGPNRFIQYLTFEEGRLIKIESGSYGYH